MFSKTPTKPKEELQKLAALDVLEARVMIADADYNIIYANPAVTGLLKDAEPDLKKELPDFDADGLVGTSIATFHKNPAHQRGMLEKLSSSVRTTIRVAVHQFDLMSSPLTAPQGKRIGTVVEWADATPRLLNLDYTAQIAAIGRSQAVIEFQMDGTIIKANDNFLNAMGYTLAEIQGKHHSIFVQESEQNSDEYKQFWERLKRGEYQAAEFKRIGKGGREVYIQASYNPILGADGKPIKVVKFATDITEQTLKNADYSGQLAAIGKSQAVIEFQMDGTIIKANDNFLNAMGYSLAEIQGKHHSIFVQESELNSDDYRQFWERLGRGEYQAAEYKRIGKGGREVYIQASYNPIMDPNGKPFKVVKYATDVTASVLARKKAEHVRSMMESVAAGAEELNASVKEIASSMTKSRDTASDAVVKVDEADKATGRLAEASEAMGQIVQVIANITAQLNLLSLNATIDSARAGEAGNGFAVVANEVKNLANEAKGATEKISEEIGRLQDVSDEVTATLQTIKNAIDTVTEYVTATTVAVEEQSAVASEMSSNMQRAAAEANSLGDAA
ncbi:MAG: PAS domain-containing protein [Kiloniellaceae bacterium]